MFQAVILAWEREFHSPAWNVCHQPFIAHQLSAVRKCPGFKDSIVLCSSGTFEDVKNLLTAQKGTEWASAELVTKADRTNVLPLEAGYCLLQIPDIKEKMCIKVICLDDDVIGDETDVRFLSTLGSSLMRVVDDESDEMEIHDTHCVLHSDFVLIHSDVIVEPKIIEEMTLQHISKEATITTAMKRIQFADPMPVKGKKKPMPGQEELPSLKKREIGDFVVLDSESNRLLYMRQHEGDEKDDLHLEKSLLTKCSRLSLRTDLTCVPLHVISKFVIDLLKQDTTLLSTKLDLLPRLFSFQYKSRHELSLSSYKNFEGDSISPFRSKSFNYLPKEDSLRLHVMEIPPTGVCDQVINRAHLLKLQTNLLKSWYPRHIPIPVGRFVFALPELSSDSLRLGDESTRAQVAKGTKPKFSVFGLNVEIGGKTSVANTLVMDNVKIGSKCKLDRCIIFPGAVLEDNVSLTCCTVEAGMTVETMTKAKDRSLEKNEMMDEDEAGMDGDWIEFS
eukprot:TRINITY_DN20618_c0_g1_i1.p1 TRINITY_DN20618_c0_g1~~TRINITY_DN20618_c0_g1_i1.p1  ORF type:complete len:504 (-),score=127.14 TRINITY_DN20618_c0_g1_i1:90-1601(-)